MSAHDITWEVATMPQGSGKSRALAMREGGGGMAANAAVAAARLGGQVALWARAGADSAGHSMRAELAGRQVNVDQLKLFEGARSSVSGIVVDASGERMIVNFRGQDLPVDPAWLPLHQVASANAVLADPRWPEGALALFQAARAAQVPTVLDGDVADAAVFDLLLPHCDHAIFSQPGLAAYASAAGLANASVEDQLQCALRRGARLAGVTLGERGVVWADALGLQRLPAFSVNVVDTTGAGDVFHGAYVLAMGAGWPVRQAFAFSSAVAALKCGHAGGREGVPDFATAVALVHTLKEFAE